MTTLLAVLAFLQTSYFDKENVLVGSDNINPILSSYIFVFVVLL